MDSIGEKLREGRHAKGVTLEDASRATKIKFDILEKLEADDFTGLVSPTYTRGFIKLYADYLGLDGHAIAAAYIESQGGLRRKGLQVETVAATRRARELQLSIRGLVVAVAGLTAGVLLIFGILSWRAVRHKKPVAPAAVPVAAPVLPNADVDAYYQPVTKPAPALLDVP